MKNCQACEKKLAAYLHGELTDRVARLLEAHLETCMACREELEAQRITLSLLGAALEAAPAPVDQLERLAAERDEARANARWGFRRRLRLRRPETEA